MTWFVDAAMRPLLVVVSTLLFSEIASSCPLPDRWASEFHSNQYSFYVDAPSQAVLSLMTPQFGALLKHEAAYSGGEVGHLDYDPWLGAQDGQPENVVFVTETLDADTALVAMRYRFILGRATKGAKRTVHLVLKKTEGCWLLHDFITPLGESLSFLYAKSEDE